MLVDSHCHLDFPDFAERARRRRRPGPRPPASADGHHLDPGPPVRRRAGDRRALSRMCAARSARIRTTPHEELDVTADDLVALAAHPKVVGDRRGGARLPLRQSPARRAGAGLSPAHRGGARAPACRSSSTPATPMTTSRRSCGRRRGRGPSPPSCTASRRAARLARSGVELGLYVSFSGILTFKNSQELRASPPKCRPTGCWSKPTRPISRRCRIAASATSRPMSSRRRECWPRFAASRSRRSPRRRRRISSASSPRCRDAGTAWPHAALHHPRLRRVARRAAGRLATGANAIRPSRATGAAAARLLVERSADEPADARPHRHRAGPPRPAPRGGVEARRRRLHPSACRPRPRHRRPPRLLARTCGGVSTSIAERGDAWSG